MESRRTFLGKTCGAALMLNKTRTCPANAPGNGDEAGGTPRTPPIMPAEKQVLHWAEHPSLALRVPEASGTVAAWQDRTRPVFRRMLGLDFFDPIHPKVEELACFTRGSLRIHRLAITPQGEPGPWEGLLIGPDTRNGSLRPAWVCTHGNIPGGKATVTGLIDPLPGAEEWLERFECDYGRQLAERGYLTLSFDCPGFGARNTNGDPLGTPASDMMLSSLYLGRPYLGWCIADAMNAISVLRAWPGVDPARIGIMGFSMGATIAAWTAAVDPRAGAAVYSGRVASPRERLLRNEKTSGPLACVPGLMDVMEYGDAMGLAAPTPMLVSQEVRGDPDVAAQRVAPLIRAYKGLHASEQLTVRYDDRGVHKFMGPAAYTWIEELWPLRAC